MPDSKPNQSAAQPKQKAPARPHGSKIANVLWRIYAIIPIVVVVVLSYEALRYLFVSLLFPYAAPQQITSIPVRLTEDVWRTQPRAWIGQELAETPRTPLSHYHQIDGWFQPDPHNDCTQSGCHTPMPHNAHKEVRAFLNMHATSIHCGVCHMQHEGTPLPLTWYDLADGTPTGPPELLRLYGWLESSEGQEALAAPSAEAQKKLVTLLRAAAAAAPGGHALGRLADEAEAVRHTSDAFQATVALVREQVPLHFHGEYGARLALRDGPAGGPILGRSGSAGATAEYLKRRETADAAELAGLLEQVHPPRRASPPACGECHGADRPLVDLETVGYPPERIRTLREGWIFPAIEHIAAGRPLYLPEFILPDDDGAPAPPTAGGPEE